jgi:hypothetical protein
LGHKRREKPIQITKGHLVERELFNWENWDLLDTGVFQFMDITLVKDIGRLKKGERYAQAVLSFQEGTLEIYDGKNWLIDRFKLSLEIN